MTDKRSDEELLTQFEAGDDMAFHKLVERYEKHLIGYLYGNSSNLELSKDVCQETFLKLIKRPPGFLFGGKIKAWLYRTGKNLLIDHLRRDSKNQPIHDEIKEEKDSLPDPQETIARQDDIEELQGIINSLKDDYKEIVVMHFYSGMKFREIAEQLNIPLGTALWRMKKAISIMQDKYEKRSNR